MGHLATDCMYDDVIIFFMAMVTIIMSGSNPSCNKTFWFSKTRSDFSVCRERKFLCF